MTRPLWVVLAMLLLAGAAGANEPTPDCLNNVFDSMTHACGKVTTWRQIAEKQDACLATMEAAMRAMEPFLGQAAMDVDTCTYKHSCTMQEGDRFTPALKQWTAAKACWREP